jgi:hypothetical protein
MQTTKEFSQFLGLGCTLSSVSRNERSYSPDLSHLNFALFFAGLQISIVFFPKIVKLCPLIL